MKICTHGHMLMDEYEADYCPIRDCNGLTFECDDTIAPAIVTLNTKGIRTLYSCGGHFGSNLIQMYIAFEPRGLNEALVLMTQILSVSNGLKNCPSLELVLYRSFDEYHAFSNVELNINCEAYNPYTPIVEYMQGNCGDGSILDKYTVKLTVNTKNETKIDSPYSVADWFGLAADFYSLALKLPTQKDLGATLNLLPEDDDLIDWIHEHATSYAKHNPSSCGSCDDDESKLLTKVVDDEDDDFEDPEDIDEDVAAKLDVALKALDDLVARKRNQKKSK